MRWRANEKAESSFQVDNDVLATSTLRVVPIISSSELKQHPSRHSRLPNCALTGLQPYNDEGQLQVLRTVMPHERSCLPTPTNLSVPSFSNEASVDEVHGCRTTGIKHIFGTIDLSIFCRSLNRSAESYGLVDNVEYGARCFPSLWNDKWEVLVLT